MIIARILRANRRWLALGLFGALPLASGCGDEAKTNGPQGAPQPAAEQDAMRKARESAYGKAANPSAKEGMGAPSAKPAEKEAAKPADAKPADTEAAKPK